MESFLTFTAYIAEISNDFCMKFTAIYFDRFLFIRLLISKLIVWKLFWWEIKFLFKQFYFIKVNQMTEIQFLCASVKSIIEEFIISSTSFMSWIVFAFWKMQMRRSRILTYDAIWHITSTIIFVSLKWYANIPKILFTCHTICCII